MEIKDKISISSSTFPAIAAEVADSLYHTMVALAHHKVDLKSVYRKLQERRQ